MLICPGDLDIAARTVWGEARGEGPDGRKGVAHALVNRWLSTEGQFQKDDTLATACLRHLQFSCWTEADPNFRKMFQVNETDDIFLKCREAVIRAVNGEDDPTQGSCHYHHIDITPYWVAGHTPVVRLGYHAFYNTIM